MTISAVTILILEIALTAAFIGLVFACIPKSAFMPHEDEQGTSEFSKNDSFVNSERMT